MSSSKHKVVSFVAALACSSLFLAGCGSNDEENEPEVTPDSSTSEEEETPAPSPEEEPDIDMGEEEEDEDFDPFPEIDMGEEGEGEYNPTEGILGTDDASGQRLRGDMVDVADTLEQMLSENSSAGGLSVNTDGESAIVIVGDDTETVRINEGNQFEVTMDSSGGFELTGHNEDGDVTEDEPLIYTSPGGFHN